MIFFKFKSSDTENTPRRSFATPPAVSASNFITVSNSHILIISSVTNVIIAFLGTVVSATFLYLFYL